MAASDESRLVVRLEASVTHLTKELTRARQHSEKEMQRMRDVMIARAAEVERIAPRPKIAEAIKRDTDLASTHLASLKARLDTSAASFTAVGARVAGAVTALVGVNELRKYADTWTETRNKIAAAGEATENLGARQSELADLAIRSRSNFGSVVDLYTGLKRATLDLGASQAQVPKVTETISKGFVVGGQSASTAAGAIIQLNQAFQSGKLSGDELNSVLEGAPPIARLIAKEFGVGVGELKKLAEAGKLTSDKVFGAILKGAGEIEAEFQKTSATIGHAVTNLETAFTRYIGKMDQATGASGALASGIQGIANNIDVVAPAAAVLAATLLGAFAGGPITAGIAGATSAMVLFGDSIKPIAGDIATLGDYGRSAFQVLGQLGSEVGPQLSSGFQRAAELATTALSQIDAGDALGALLEGVKTALNATIGAFVAAAQAIRVSWASLGPVLAETITAAMNAVIATVQAAVNKVIGSINSITSSVNAAGSKVGIDVGLGEIKPVDLGKVTTRYEGAGKAAGEAYGKAFDLAQKDYIGGAMRLGSATIEDMRKRANAAAAQRIFSTPTGSLDNGSLDAKLKARPGAAAGGGGGSGGGAERANDLDREIESIQRRTRAFEDEQKVVGRSAEEAAKADASFRLLEAAKRANIPVTDDLKSKVDSLATAYAAARVHLDEAERAHRTLEQSQRFLGDAMSDAVSDLVLEGKTASEVFANLAKSIAKAALQAALMGNGPFGSSGSGGAGGLFGLLFKGASSFFAADGYVPGYAEGGMPAARSSTGMVSGPGTGLSDSILAVTASGQPIRIANGESIVTARATAENRPLIKALNAGARPRELEQVIRQRPIPVSSLPAFARGTVSVPGTGLADTAEFSQVLDFGERRMTSIPERRHADSLRAFADNARNITNNSTVAPVINDHRHIEIKPANGVTPAEMVAALKKYDADLSRNLLGKLQDAQMRRG